MEDELLKEKVKEIEELKKQLAELRRAQGL
jgi:hypothetical protein